MQTIGVREFKARLSHHLKRVRAGARVRWQGRGRGASHAQRLSSCRHGQFQRRDNLALDEAAGMGGVFILISVMAPIGAS